MAQWSNSQAFSEEKLKHLFSQYIWMFIAALLSLKTGNSPNVHQLVNEQTGVHMTMEYYQE